LFRISIFEFRIFTNMAKRLHLGKAFPDQFKKVSIKYSHHRLKSGGRDWQEFMSAPNLELDNSLLNSWRKLIFVILGILIFFGIFLRLFHLQVVKGDENRQLADFNRIKVRVIHAPRGVIYDRTGRILAQNEPGYRLAYQIGQFAKVSHISRDEAVQMEVRNNPRFQDLELDAKRYYPFGEKTAHILGYVGEISEDELKERDFQNYSLGDSVGRGGIEQAYEKVLRGIDGGEIIEVDAAGRPIRTLRKIDAVPGQNVYLTIDASLQEVAYTQLQKGVASGKSCCGALVGEDPKSGEILTLVSIPSFNPNDIAGSLENPNSPFLNRAIGGVYPPGSTFKIASSLAGLSSGKITEKTVFEDTGVMSIGPYKFANWYFTDYGKTEGYVDVIKALQRSNDIFFYQLGQQIGEKVLGEYSKKLGLGKKLGIDIPGEEDGLIPTDEWKRTNYDQVWYPGDTLHMAIGQGFVLSTPLQILNLVSTIAADGKQYPPHLALKITSPSGRVVKEYQYSPISSSFKDTDIALVRKGLEQVPKFGGTAWPFFNFPLATAGKTGTAEFGDPTDKTHAWYVSYAPVDEPKLALSVLVEAGGEGSNTSAPVTKEVFRWYLSPDKANLLKDINQVATESAKTLGE
jgi:penicillin-binding protein 2